MTFTTLTFLLFLPLVWAIHWRLRGQAARNALLVVASYVFYGWWDARFAVLMLAASLFDFGAGLWIERARTPAARRAILAASCCCSLGLLGFFKYFGFFAESAVAAARALGFSLTPTTLHVVLPVGISFYTFQTMSYVIDVYRRRLPATRGLVEYLAYVSFFPQLVAGPIERATHLLPQFQTPRVFDPQAASDACRLILWGFVKKMALADNLAHVVSAAYGDAQASGPRLAFATLAFAFQIYCDFSAYSDIATGTAALFGVQLMRNFALPYFSSSVAEFWRRWHVSLSSWFSDYVYVSLGGNRVARARVAFNVLVTFGLSGLWHGAAWHYVAWGLLNGLAVLPSVLHPPRRKVRAGDLPGGDSRVPGRGTLLRMAATFTLVCIGWIFFRAVSLDDAWRVLTAIAGGPWTVGAVTLPLRDMWLLAAALAVFVVAEWLSRGRRHPLAVENWPRPARWLAYTLLIWGTLAAAPPVASPFIYFQF
jgi:D-alanyl-lipoteichoic acid acyltransferase DltB (MBOAT superfamily)